jgi:glycopeptide antibiotics resistance protein
VLRQLITAFVRLAAVALPLWILLRAATAWRGRRVDPRREAWLLGWLFYWMVMAALTLMPIPMARRLYPPAIAWSPVRAIVCTVPGMDVRADAPYFCGRNLVGNVLLFMPFGALLRRRGMSVAQMIVCAAALSAGIEFVQWLEHRYGIYRAIDAGDVLFNVTGAALGFAFAPVMMRRRIASDR